MPRSTAMKMVGHKTEAIYRRYAIADERALREDAAELEAVLEAQRGAFRVVVPLRNDKVSAKSAGESARRDGVSAAPAVGLRSRDVICQTRTRDAAGAHATASTIRAAHETYSRADCRGWPGIPIARVIDANVYVRHERGGLMLGGNEADPWQVDVSALSPKFDIAELPLDIKVLWRLARSVSEQFPISRTRPSAWPNTGAGFPSSLWTTATWPDRCPACPGRG